MDAAAGDDSWGAQGLVATITPTSLAQASQLQQQLPQGAHTC
jgi:hypothetical protein